MATTRRDFLRTSACALGSMAMASSIESFGIVHALTPQAATDYKALVCIFLNGGNDGNNLLVSLDQYADYANFRGPDLAIPQANLLSVSPVSGGSYGFHPNMPDMRDLFNQGRLAVVCNNGPLVEPLTRTTYQNGTGKKPLQLFSHSDQVGLFQTAIANVVSQTGWGGRVSDLTKSLNGLATFPQNVSIAGINLLLTGVDTRQLAVADSGTTLANVLQLNNGAGASASDNASRTVSFNELRTLDNNFTLVKAASDTRSSALETDVALSSVNPILTTVFPNTSLGRQLLQIARLIKACTDPTAGINMKRQIFFAQIGGFDTHSNQRVVGQDALLLQVNAAMKAFYDATIELGQQNNVTTFTLSDFSRTFRPAGTGAAAGSDHAWGNHHLVLGGAVAGHTLYGTYPMLQPGGANDTDGGTSPRGRWIPTTSVEQYAATLATWYGLSPSDLTAVFPLIGRFSSPNLGFV
jgi:uncharacterized protein (DUF1501 family)